MSPSSASRVSAVLRPNSAWEARGRRLARTGWDSRTIPLEHPKPGPAGALGRTTLASRIARISATRRSRAYIATSARKPGAKPAYREA